MNQSGGAKKEVNSKRKTPLGIERYFDRFGNWLDSSRAVKFMAPLIERHPISVKVLTWLMRLLVGVTFAVSGFTKGIDPWGTYYKMQEYLMAMHIPLSEWGNIVLTLSFFLFGVEFVIGISLLTGCFRKATPIMSALFMLVMLPLTFWIAVADPVADCGCFGEFLVISNWGTFLKNVFLSVAILWLLRFNRRAACLISPYLQWLGAVGMAVYILAVGLIGYRQQPMIDFRQYKVGSRLIAEEETPEYMPVYEFIYQKDGEEKRFGEEDELPDETDGWKFVRREEKAFVREEASGQAEEEVAGDFRIWNEDASEDVTESLSGVEEQLILLSPDIKGLSMAESWKINRLYDISTENGVQFFAIASGSLEDIENWRDLSSGQYPIYTAEDTSIKELVRGNPALVSLKDGKIVWKSALSAIVMSDPVLPSISDDLSTSDNSENPDAPSDQISTYPIGMAMSGTRALECLSIILAAFLGMIALASHLSISHVAPCVRRRCEAG